MNNIITITGYRQRGKTHAGLSIAAADALHGRTVVWITRGLSEGQMAFGDLIENYLHPDLVEKAWHTNGRQRIHVKALLHARCDRVPEIDPATGMPRGRILFNNAALRSSEYTDSRHTFIFDEAPVPYGFVRANPNAHIYVTVLPPGGEG